MNTGKRLQALIQSHPPFVLPVSGAVAWWDATQITGLTDGDSVSTWSNQFLIAYPLVSTAGTPPVYKVGIQNGLPVVRFGGAGGLRAAAVTIDDFTIFMVVNPVPSPAMIYEHSDNWNWGQGSGVYWGGGSFCMVNRNFQESYQTAVPGGLPAVFQILEHRYASGLLYPSRVYVNDVLVAEGTEGVTTLSPQSCDLAFNVGSRGGNSLFSAMDVGEIIVYPRLLSNDDCATIEAYLYNKWFA